MRGGVLVAGVLGAAALAVGGCIPAKIVEADGPVVTYAWSSADTSINRVYTLAINYCDNWNAPPALVADYVDGERHTTTFRCKSRPTLPFNQSPPGRLLNRL